MPDIFFQILFLILAYLLGSIPWGFLIGKIKGVDIREQGSKNIGATNTGRVLGKKYFYIVSFLDLFKGFIFVFLFRYKILPFKWCLLSPMLYGVVACLGHVFPIYLKFKGGKAVATGAGTVLGYAPLIFLIGAIVFFTTWAISKYVSLGSLFAASVIFICSITYSLVSKEFKQNLFSIPEGKTWPLNIWFVVGVLLIVLLIFIKHKSNIHRLANNEENKFELK